MNFRTVLKVAFGAGVAAGAVGTLAVQGGSKVLLRVGAKAYNGIRDRVQKPKEPGP